MPTGRQGDGAEAFNLFEEMSDRDPNAIEIHPVKLYRGAELVLEVCAEQGLSGVLRKPDLQEQFVVVEIQATRAQFRAAQLEWLQRMAWALPKNKSSEPELI
jgi:hypothetical protein